VYSSIATEPASLSRKWVDETRNLGFNGIVVTDDLGMLEYSGYTAEKAVQEAIRANNDMLLYSDTTASYSALLNYAEAAIKQQGIDDKTINEKLRKILQKKIN
jgi:beta-N-acetylhexosaminidase